jgi:hypothetical protein
MPPTRIPAASTVSAWRYDPFSLLDL